MSGSLHYGSDYNTGPVVNVRFSGTVTCASCHTSMGKNPSQQGFWMRNVETREIETFAVWTWEELSAIQMNCWPSAIIEGTPKFHNFLRAVMANHHHTQGILRPLFFWLNRLWHPQAQQRAAAASLLPEGRTASAL